MFSPNKNKNLKIIDIKGLSDKRVGVFGYGSLMYPLGINGRGMSKIYTRDDLSEGILNDFERGVSVYSEGTFFYGATHVKGSRLNGMMFGITIKDLVTLSISEKAFPLDSNSVYGICDVTDNASNTHNYDVVVSFVNDKLTPDKPLYEKLSCGYTLTYLGMVSMGIQYESEKFKKDFYKYGGVML